VITSPNNRRVARAVRLKKRALRERDRRFLVEGVQGVREALLSGATVHEVFHTSDPETRLQPVIRLAREAGVPSFEVSPDVMARLTSTVTPQGVVAAADFVDVPLESIPDEAQIVPILVEVRDPGNAGTIVRSADAAGAGAVVFARSSVDVYNEKAVRATAGSLFHLPVIREVDAADAVDRLRRAGFTVVAAEARGEASIYETDLTAPTAILFGNEARGLSERAAALADRTIRVPIAGRAESLNLAAATALVLFEAARQAAVRSGGGPIGSSEQAGGGGGDGAGEASLAGIVAGSAHDIRSPLAAMLGFTSTMLSRWERLDDEQKLAMIEGMAHDATRMRLLVAQLVDAARLATGELRLRTDVCDLAEVARKVAREVSGAGLEVEVAGGGAVTADPERVHTILAAAVEAAQWWGERGPVTVTIDGGSVEVRRDGSSFDAQTARTLLGPRRPGTGGGSKVGLFVARGLAQAHGGTFDVGSRDGAIVLTLALPERPPPSPPAA
jgi:TrmH family RNA methyltransferase